MVKKLDKELGVAEVIPWDADENDWQEKPKKSEVSHYTAELTKENDIENDYKYQRENFYNLVERGSDAIEGILELAKEGEHPEVTEKLGDLQEKMRKLKEVPDKAPKNVTNALFVGSTAELQKLIKGK